MTTKFDMPNPWVDYPELNLFGNSIIALADLAAADRALIVAGQSESWAMLFLRKDGKLRVFDDLNSESYRRMEGREHCMDLLPEEVFKFASINSDIDSFVSQLNCSTYYNGFTSGEMVERENGFLIRAYIDFSPSSRHVKNEDAKKENTKIEDALKKLFVIHLGVDLDDLRATGGEWNFRTDQLENASPISEIPLRPLTPISSDLRRRRITWDL